MTLTELIKASGELPNKGTLANGMMFETDVQKNGQLGYIARMWLIKGLSVKETVLDYGTGSTPEAAKQSLKNKILKV
jgi:hypothetical protein